MNRNTFNDKFNRHYNISYETFISILTMLTDRLHITDTMAHVIMKYAETWYMVDTIRHMVCMINMLYNNKCNALKDNDMEMFKQYSNALDNTIFVFYDNVVLNTVSIDNEDNENTESNNDVAVENEDVTPNDINVDTQNDLDDSYMDIVNNILQRNKNTSHTNIMNTISQMNDTKNDIPQVKGKKHILFARKKSNSA